MARCSHRFVLLGIALLVLFATGAGAQAVGPTETRPDNSLSAGPAAQPDPDLALLGHPTSEQGQTQPATTPGDQGDADTKDKNGTSNDRLFFTLPNFLTIENTGKVPPLTAGQKFKVVARSSFDYVEYPWAGFLAGISQAENSEPGYGQGAKGYAKRYGASFGDSVIENFWVGAILPSALHQDPRFFEMGKGSFMHRLTYAVSRIFITRGDSGNSEFNYSEIFGSAISAGISTYSYHPREDRTLVNAASVWGTQIGWDTITIVVKEFWPDIRRAIRKPKQPDPAIQKSSVEQSHLD